MVLSLALQWFVVVIIIPAVDVIGLCAPACTTQSSEHYHCELLRISSGCITVDKSTFQYELPCSCQWLKFARKMRNGNRRHRRKCIDISKSLCENHINHTSLVSTIVKNAESRSGMVFSPDNQFTQQSSGHIHKNTANIPSNNPPSGTRNKTNGEAIDSKESGVFSSEIETDDKSSPCSKKHGVPCTDQQQKNKLQKIEIDEFETGEFDKFQLYVDEYQVYFKNKLLDIRDKRFPQKLNQLGIRLATDLSVDPDPQNILLIFWNLCHHLDQMKNIMTNVLFKKMYIKQEMFGLNENYHNNKNRDIGDSMNELTDDAISTDIELSPTSKVSKRNNDLTDDTPIFSGKAARTEKSYFNMSFCHGVDYGVRRKNNAASRQKSRRTFKKSGKKGSFDNQPQKDLQHEIPTNRYTNFNEHGNNQFLKNILMKSLANDGTRSSQNFDYQQKPSRKKEILDELHNFFEKINARQYFADKLEGKKNNLAVADGTKFNRGKYLGMVYLVKKAKLSNVNQTSVEDEPTNLNVGWDLRFHNHRRSRSVHSSEIHPARKSTDSASGADLHTHNKHQLSEEENKSMAFLSKILQGGIQQRPTNDVGGQMPDGVDEQDVSSKVTGTSDASTPLSSTSTENNVQYEEARSVNLKGGWSKIIKRKNKEAQPNQNQTTQDENSSPTFRNKIYIFGGIVVMLALGILISLYGKWEADTRSRHRWELVGNLPVKRELSYWDSCKEQFQNDPVTKLQDTLEIPSTENKIQESSFIRDPVPKTSLKLQQPQFKMIHDSIHSESEEDKEEYSYWTPQKSNTRNPSNETKSTKTVTIYTSPPTQEPIGKTSLKLQQPQFKMFPDMVSGESDKNKNEYSNWKPLMHKTEKASKGKKSKKYVTMYTSAPQMLSTSSSRKTDKTEESIQTEPRPMTP